MTRASALCLTAVLWTFTAVDAQQPRDNRRPADTGNGTISGIVTDATDGRPLRRARVRINGDELALARMTITADDGTFSFEGLPAGRYTLNAAKEGHVAMNFGAPRPQRPGRSIVLGGTAPTPPVRVGLPRGSVITGAVLSPAGDPAPGVNVMVLASQYDVSQGERRLSTVPNGTVTTDDRGVYRIFGLPAGNYVVAAVPRGGAQGLLGDVHVMSQSEVRAALAEVRAGRTATRPGIPEPPRAATIPTEPPRSVTLTPVFYPGTVLQARAAPIDLSAGEVRHGIDIDLEYVPTATVEGLVTVPPGMRVQLMIADADPTAANQTTRLLARPGDDGRFSFGRIAPGSYTISARAFPSGARDSPAETSLWGETGVIVAGEDISGVTVSLVPALSIAGRVIFDSSTGFVPNLRSIRLPLPLVSMSGAGSAPLPSVVVDGSRFSITGVIPGRYRFSSPPRGIRAPIGPWWLKSMILNGRELLDSELELRESTDEAVITFGDRASELSGYVREPDGSPLADGFVVVFASERRFWFHNSRRVAGVRLSGQGRYVVRNLPAGEYLLAVTGDIDFNEWFDPEALQALSKDAIRLSLQEDEARVQDLTRR
jgi:uncharacterized protein (DUF2141 family)